MEIPGERLKEITECKGAEITIQELYQFRENMMISPDFLVGNNNFLFDFEPSEENLQAFILGVLERLKELEDKE